MIDSLFADSHVDDRFIPMTPEEAHLHERIERYISRFYNKYLTASC